MSNIFFRSKISDLDKKCHFSPDFRSYKLLKETLIFQKVDVVLALCEILRHDGEVDWTRIFLENRYTYLLWQLIQSRVLRGLETCFPEFHIKKLGKSAENSTHLPAERDLEYSSDIRSIAEISEIAEVSALNLTFISSQNASCSSVQHNP